LHWLALGDALQDLQHEIEFWLGGEDRKHP
jgi:hypothetical protein